MDRKLRNRILLYLLLAAVLAYAGIRLSERKPAPKIAAVTPVRENLISSISSNGKVEPIRLMAWAAALVNQIGPATYCVDIYIQRIQQPAQRSL